jgi:hypothetical protein
MLCLIFLAAFADNIFACSCMAKPTVLDSFEDSDLVVIVKAVSVEMREEAKGVDLEAEIKRAGYDTSYSYVKSTKMKVEKVYKGSVKVGDELLFGQGGGADCIWTFGIKSVGESFLFYLGKPSTNHPFFNEIKMSDKPAYFPVTCGRSQYIVGYETDDLKYLNNLEKVKGKTRISGDLNCWSAPCPKVADVNIKIVGEKKTYEIKTDEHGTYEIYDLPPGKYFINPEIPKGWKLSQFMLQYSPAFRQNQYAFYGDKLEFSKGIPLNLEAGKHNGIDFYFDIDTAIRGKVLSPDGKPLKGVCVKAVSIELKEGDYRGRSDCTNEDGIFLIEEMAPGKYVLVANDDGKISSKEPFGILFYPNTANYKDAKPVEIKLGEHLDNFTIQILKTEELITISGKFTYSDGKPVADEWIKFEGLEKNEKFDAEQRGKTDENGYFSFKILKNLKGKLYGEMYSYVGEFENCPQTDKAVKEASGGKTNAELKTNSIEIDATKDAVNLRIKFPFPSCEKSK